MAAPAARHHAGAVSTRLAPLDQALDILFALPRLDAYYLRESWTHGLFGTPLLTGWIAARRRLRALRGALA